MNKQDEAHQVLSKIDKEWDKMMIKKYGEVRHIYKIPKEDYEIMYKKVCKRVSKDVTHLRRYGYEYCELVVGKKMAIDCLFALVD